MQSENSGDDGPGRYEIGASQWRLFFAVLVIGGAGLAYYALTQNGLQNSAALYMGLPILLALGLSLTPRTRSIRSATMKGMTIALLLSAPVFREGYICVLFAAPIFYLVGFYVAAIVQRYREGRGSARSALACALLAVMALEGTSRFTSFPREHDVIVSKTVEASVQQVRDALARTPSFDGSKPFFLRIFPYPVAMSGEGVALGDRRRATFVAYKHIFWNRIEGDAVFEVTEATDRKIRFSLVSDTSYVGHYVGWKTSEVALVPLGDARTQVTWTLSFHRKYDPYWYFGTLQKYAVRLVAGELIDHAATPGT